MGRREKQTAMTQRSRDLAPLTAAELYAIRYLHRWGTMFGKPLTMSGLQRRGLVEQCGAASPKLLQWQLTRAGRDLVV